MPTQNAAALGTLDEAEVLLGSPGDVGGRVRDLVWLRVPRGPVDHLEDLPHVARLRWSRFWLRS